MHNHIDRDKYVDIHWANIERKHRHNFEKVSAWKYDNFGTPFDFFSIMNYHSKTFSWNGKSTIVPKWSFYKEIMGKRNELSTGDVTRLKKMYDCK